MSSEFKILIVEDDPDHMRLLAHILTFEGYRVVQGYGGLDALRKVKTQLPDLILTDISMPDMSGVDLIAGIKSDPETRAIPVIAVTAHAWDKVTASAHEAGCAAVIPKPYQRAQLLREVAAHLPVRAAGDGVVAGG